MDIGIDWDCGYYTTCGQCCWCAISFGANGRIDGVRCTKQIQHPMVDPLDECHIPKEFRI